MPLGAFALGFALGAIAGFGLSELVRTLAELFSEKEGRNKEKVRIPIGPLRGR